MATVKEINYSIMFGDLTNEELNSVISAVRFARANLAKINKRSFRIGAEVKFTSSQSGQTYVGLVNKIMRKNVMVQVGSRMWRVPANMLTASEV